MPRQAATLWHCPGCGHEFVTAHMWHSCSSHAVDEHFDGKPAALRSAFDRCIDILSEVGPVTVIAQKTRIVVMVRVRFNGAVVRKAWLDYTLALREPADHRLLRKRVQYGPRWIAHTFRLSSPDDIDEQITAWLKRSYQVGAQLP